MNILTNLLFVFILINVIVFLIRNSKNPNKNNRVLSEYDFVKNTEKQYDVEEKKQTNSSQSSEVQSQEITEQQPITFLSSLMDIIDQIFKPKLKTENIEYWKLLDSKSYYADAKKNNRTADFYFGRDKYLFNDRDCGGHSTLITFSCIEAYARINGNKKMLDEFKQDLEALLSTDLNCNELDMLIHYIFLYQFHFYKEAYKEFSIEWRVEERIRTLLKKQLKNFEGKYPISNNQKYLSDGFFYTNLIHNINRIKNDFGIDLMDEKGINDIDYITLGRLKFEKKLKENRYLEAREKNEVKEYLLGEGKYKLTNGNTNEHVRYLTFNQLKFYGKIHGNETLFDNIENDILSIIKQDIIIAEFFAMMNYVSDILFFKREINYSLKLKDELVSVIKEKLHYFDNQYKIDSETNINSPETNISYFEKINSLAIRIYKNYSIQLK